MDLSELKGIISLMQKSDLTDLEIETQDLKLRLARPKESKSNFPTITETIHTPPPAVEKPTPTDTPTDQNTYIFKSPMVGTFYRKPSPDDPSFVSLGDTVKSGDTLCIVEAMKVMNEVQSDQAGEIIEILVEDSESVEYGQPLFVIRK